MAQRPTTGRTLFGASANRDIWKAAIHQVVHRMGRHFGFQAFNEDPRSKLPGSNAQAWVPATIFLVTDHLDHLLVKNYMRRERDLDEHTRFDRAVRRLHAGIFQGYADWCKHVELPMRRPEVELATLKKYGQVTEWEYLLEELAVYFLIYSEAANLRHMPESLWFIFWVVRNSEKRYMVVSCPAATDMRSAVAVAASPRVEAVHGIIRKRQHLRNRYHAQIVGWRSQLRMNEGENLSVEDQAVRFSEAKRLITATGVLPAAQPIPGATTDTDLLAEMVVYGDAGAFLEKVVGPIFGFLAVQVFELGVKEVEPAARVTYDDCDESLTQKDRVHKVLKRLGVEPDAKRPGRFTFSSDPFDALIHTGMMQVGVDTGNGISPAGQTWNMENATTWYSKHVFAKTFVERRSLFTVYRAFFRVWVFFFMEFQVMAVFLWGCNSNLKTCNRNAAASIPMTHAGLCLLEQIGAAWTQRSPAKGVELLGEPFFGRSAWGVLHQLIINVVMYLCMAAQFTGFSVFKTYNIWWWVCVGYAGLVVVHAIISQRDGYCVSITHTIAGSGRRGSKGSCGGSIWRGFWEWVGASSARPAPDAYLAPYNMKVGWRDFFVNAIFWVLVLGGKFMFDWFAVMKTMEIPVLGLWNLGEYSSDWLPTTIFGLHINANFILCIARCVPGFLVVMNDTQIFYYVIMAAFGCTKGLFQLNLGSITNFQDVVASFHKAPGRWWKRGISDHGTRNINKSIEDGASQQTSNNWGKDRGAFADVHVPGEALQGVIQQRRINRDRLSMSMSARRPPPPNARRFSRTESQQVRESFSDESIVHLLMFSDIWNGIVKELREGDLISNSERDNLLFVHLTIDQSIVSVDGMRPFMLPIFFYGGKIAGAMESGGEIDASQSVAVREVKSLLIWLLLQLGMIDEDQSVILSEFTPVANPLDLNHRSKRVKAVAQVTNFLKGLQTIQKSVVMTRGPTGEQVPNAMAEAARRAAAQALQGCLSELAELLQKEVENVFKVHQHGTRSAADVSPGRLAHDRAEKVKGILFALTSPEGGVLTRLWDPALKESKENQHRWNNAIEFHDINLECIYAESDDSTAKQNIDKIVTHVIRLLQTGAKGAQPRGEEAERVLAAFMESLNNETLEKPPAVEDMLSFNTLTPHYEEDVIYALNSKNLAQHLSMDPATTKGMVDLLSDTGDGVTTMDLLKSNHTQEWQNFLERHNNVLKEKGLLASYVTEADFDVGGPLHCIQMDLLLWASYRSQLLARTVRGIMTCEKALRLLAHMETPKPPSMSIVSYAAAIEDCVSSKFTYVVAAQKYGDNRKAKTAKDRWLASGVDHLLQMHPGLRVAFIDSQPTERGKEQFTVLIRGRVGTPAADPNCTEELYRVRLPKSRAAQHGVILGEGKPENQNASIIFCFGEVVQAIDMNQDQYFSEALKMRNLVSEFNAPNYSNPAPAKAATLKTGVAAPANGTEVLPPGERPFPDMGDRPVALVGFREVIFSQDQGALAGFAAATEYTFGSMVQRIMTWPGSVRFHYGHPDLWNKLFVMTRGGVSKATKGFHISEDVFAGYNHTMRGGRTKFKEYISVGKGRDMGFDSINGFEAKVSGGNGEQVMSRDVHRLATQFDFFRLLAFYHSGPGFFINTTLVMYSVYANIWVMLLLALSNAQEVVDPRQTPTADDDFKVYSTLSGQDATVTAQQILQLGMFSVVTYAFELLLERGLATTLGILLAQLVQGSIAFFVFRARTTNFNFMSDVRYGGAKYVGTGRGFSIKHNSFVHVYSMYARSHLYFAWELVFIMVLLAFCGGQHYAATTWSTWLVAVSLLWSPFWFNPGTFVIEKCTNDFKAWRLWMSDIADTVDSECWSKWNKEKLSKMRNENNQQTNPYATAMGGVLACLPTAILAISAITHLDDTAVNKWITFAVMTGGFWVFLGVVLVMRKYLLHNNKYRYWRLVRTAAIVIAIVGLICAIIFIPDSVSGVGLRNVIIIIFANIEGVVVATQLLMFLGRRHLWAVRIVDAAYHTLDWTLGFLLFLFLFPLAFIQLVDKIQGALLFNMKFAKQLQLGQLMSAKGMEDKLDRSMARMEQELLEKAGQRKKD